MRAARTVGLVHGLYAPNAPNLIDPAVFGGVGETAVKALRSLDLVRRWTPEAIVVATPHWASPDTFLVQSSARPRQIYDFSGFPHRLFEVKYAPPGDPELARRLVEAGRRRHLSVTNTEEWGLDHGAWATLVNVAPGASVRVVPISIARLPPREHLAWGAAIGSALREMDRRVAFVATGSITHRLDRFDLGASEPWPEAEAVEKKIVDLILARKYAELAEFDREKWSTVAPEGDLGPLFILAGALGPGARPRLVATEQAFGSVSLTTIEFEPSQP